jgi:indole-3-glycerol phosphate synthase
LQKAGAQGFLVGESLMRDVDIGAKLRELQGDSN